MDAERLAEIREEIRVAKGLWEYDSYGTALDPDKWPLKQLQELDAYVDDLEASLARLRVIALAGKCLRWSIYCNSQDISDARHVFAAAYDALQPGDLGEASCDEQR